MHENCTGLEDLLKFEMKEIEQKVPKHQNCDVYNSSIIKYIELNGQSLKSYFCNTLCKYSTDCSSKKE